MPRPLKVHDTYTDLGASFHHGEAHSGKHCLHAEEGVSLRLLREDPKPKITNRQRQVIVLSLWPCGFVLVVYGPLQA